MKGVCRECRFVITGDSYRFTRVLSLWQCRKVVLRTVRDYVAGTATNTYELCNRLNRNGECDNFLPIPVKKKWWQRKKKSEQGGELSYVEGGELSYADQD